MEVMSTSVPQLLREIRQWRRVELSSTIGGMLVAEIPSRLKEMRRSQADLARHLKLDPSSLVKTIKGERRVQPAELTKLEAFFGERVDVDAMAPAGARRRPASSKIPVYGYAAGDEDRIAYADDAILAYYDPPPFWNGEVDLIYVRLLGDSMEPRYFSGEIVPVRLKLEPAKGQDALIVFNDATAMIKTFTGRRDGKVFATQYNDRREQAYEATSIRAMHAIWRPGML